MLRLVARTIGEDVLQHLRGRDAGDSLSAISADVVDTFVLRQRFCPLLAGLELAIISKQSRERVSRLADACTCSFLSPSGSSLTLE